MDLSAAQQSLVQRLLAGEARAAARVARAVDERAPGYLELLSALHPHTGRARIVGVTGSPGAGKSTLVDRLVSCYRAREQRVGVLAVDPSSPFTGGAILGDRIRMQRHALDAGVFIRSLSTRGHLGGLSRSAADVARVLDAHGCDVVIVETVGVGQDELEVARLAQTTVVVMAPGGGDDIQAVKAGILEIADVFVVNKADRTGADATVRDIESMLALGEAVERSSAVAGHSAAAMAAPAAPGGEGERWAPPVLRCVAADGTGVDALVEACDAHARYLQHSEAGRARKARLQGDELARVFQDLLHSQAQARFAARLQSLGAQVVAGEVDPYRAAANLVEEVLGERQERGEVREGGA